MIRPTDGEIVLAVEGSRHFVGDGRPRGLEPVVVALADGLAAPRPPDDDNGDMGRRLVGRQVRPCRNWRGNRRRRAGVAMAIEMEDVGMTKKYPGQGSPWADFLHHRARALRELRDEGRTSEEIARTMTMDPGQVRLILMTVDEHPEDYQ